MAKIKISKVAKDLNVALPTVIEFLRKKNITIDDNPNARIEDDIVEILANEFRSDKDQKSKSEQLSSERQKEKAKPAPKEAPAPVEEIVLPIEPAIAPKIVGKIDINNVGKSTPKEPEKVVEEKQPKKEEPKAKEVVAETKTKEAPKKPVQPAPKKQQEPKAIVKDEKPVKPEPIKEVEVSQPKEDQEEEIFTMSRPTATPTINVVGKIDLSAINQQTRPKKKTKEEKRKERLAKDNAAQQNNAAAQNGDRKKRKRIMGKEKIDIEKIYNEIYKEAKDAYYTKEPFTIYPEVEGIDFDVENAKLLINPT